MERRITSCNADPGEVRTKQPRKRRETWSGRSQDRPTNQNKLVCNGCGPRRTYRAIRFHLRIFVLNDPNGATVFT